MAVVRLSVALLAASLTLSVAHAQQPLPGDSRRGKDVAASFCRGCHLIAPDDRGPVPDGVPSFMAMAAKQGQSTAALEASLVGKHPVMPASPITSQQAADVVAYIMTLRP
jgi:mono/diheme cytochrome c family protein